MEARCRVGGGGWVWKEIKGPDCDEGRSCCEVDRSEDPEWRILHVNSTSARSTLSDRFSTQYAHIENLPRTHHLTQSGGVMSIFLHSSSSPPQHQAKGARGT